MFFCGSNDSLSRFFHFSGPLLGRVAAGGGLGIVRKRRGPWDCLLTFFEPEGWHRGSLASGRPEGQVSRDFRDSVA